MRRFAWRALALGIMLAGCGVGEVVEDDGASDSFLGEAATQAVTEGSPQAKALLDVASFADDDVLKRSDQVGLSLRSARSLIAYRNGPDGKENTADDRVFGSL